MLAGVFHELAQEPVGLGEVARGRRPTRHRCPSRDVDLREVRGTVVHDFILPGGGEHTQTPSYRRQVLPVFPRTVAVLVPIRKSSPDCRR